MNEHWSDPGQSRSDRQVISQLRSLSLTGPGHEAQANPSGHSLLALQRRSDGDCTVWGRPGHHTG